MKGTILKTGKVLGEDKKIYEPDMIHDDTILLVCYSWARQNIKDLIGKKVEFVISPKGHAYNFNLID